MQILILLSAVAYIVVLGLVAKFIAQKIYPTLIADSYGKRFSYRALVGMVTVGLIILQLPLLFMLESLGIRV